MKIYNFFFLSFFFLSSGICAQDSVDITLEEKNNTGRDLYIYKTQYYTDSTRAYASNQSPKGTSTKLFSELHYIRIDYIAIDAETKDTLCRISAFKEELERGLVSFEIGLNRLKQPYKIQPRLRINGKEYRKVLKIGDPIEIKLITNKKITGNIYNYDNNKMTLLNEANQKIEILPKDIKRIKSCRYLFAYGANVVELKNCKYNNVKNVAFELVEQKFNTKKRFWEWVKIE